MHCRIFLLHLHQPSASSYIFHHLRLFLQLFRPTRPASSMQFERGGDLSPISSPRDVMSWSLASSASHHFALFQVSCFLLHFLYCFFYQIFSRWNALVPWTAMRVAISESDERGFKQPRRCPLYALFSLFSFCFAYFFLFSFTSVLSYYFFLFF